MSLGPLVQPNWLLEHLGETGLVVVDCRFVLGEPRAGERAWLAGHIPGAAALDLDRDLASDPGAGGRHPLPGAARFAAAARRAGVGSKTRVVAYDESGEGGAARLWWLLRHFGHEAVAVLDGGLKAWREANGPLRHGREQLAPGDFEARAAEGDTVSAEEIARGLAAQPGPTLRLLDARAPERFRGETEPVDRVAGHIPGAVSVPSATVAPGGRFLAPERLREQLGDEPFVAYCGSGVTACTLLLTAELAGVEARLYPGSWSEWSASGRPVAIGAD